MNKIVGKMLQIINKTDPTIHDDVALNAIHYVMGLVASSVDSKFTVYGNVLPINYFGLTLAGSGEGKDRSVDIAKGICSSAIEMYHIELVKRFAKFNSLLGPKDRPVPLPMFEFERATVEGFLAPRVDIQTVGFGCSNLRIPEIQDMLTSKESLEIFSEVVKAWEVGDAGGKSNRGQPIEPTKGIPVNVLVYGSPNAIKTNKSASEHLLKMLTSGLGRRAFLAAPPKHEVQALLRALPVPDAISIRAEAVRIADAVEMTRKVGLQVKLLMKVQDGPLKLSEDANILYAQYNHQCKTAFVDDKTVSDGLTAEMLGRGWKMVRLSAMYAWYDDETEISEQNVLDAIDYTERCGRNVENLYHIPSNPELVMSYLEIQKGPVSRQSIMKEALDASAVRDFDDAMALAEELADERNQVIEISEDKIPKYSITQLSKIDLSKITISTSTAMGVGWKPLTGEFKDLAGFLKSGLWYSAGTFRDGIRDNDHYERDQDLLMFDIDEDMTLAQAQSFFKDFKCIIATTKSHQREKHPGTGDIWDRFRVIMVPDSKIELDPIAYSQFMLNAMDMMGLPADRSCQDPARFFYGNKHSEVWVSEGTKLFPVSACIPSTAKSVVVLKRLEKYDNVDGIERFFIASTDKGDRNNKLFRYAKVLQDDDRYTDDEVEVMVRALNDKIADPLPQRELEVTILRSIRKK